MSLAMSTALSALMATQRMAEIVSHNIANVNTPGYKRYDVNFDDELRSIIESGEYERLRSVEPQVVQPDDPPMRPDGNNVNVDAEMAALVKNTLIYNTYVQILANKFSGLRSAITGK